MSCIAGIVNLDGAPVDCELLERMTGVMKDRAPDESNVWISGNVGFGHALLRISPEKEHQPCTLDGKVWITADVRIDGRAELITKLRTTGQRVQDETPDVELILHAYASFGETFLDHLIGDFAFALWDSRGEKLIFARDHFGVRPFFYAKTERALVFASDVDALLAHPAVTRQLDEQAIADFLLFGTYQQEELSIYKNIRCLPAAHRGQLEKSVFRIGKYWELSPNNEIRYRHNSEYVDHFLEIFEMAVLDRTRADHVALELSGGMDSTSIAAIAAGGNSPSSGKLSAYTSTCNGLLPADQEGFYAGMVASHLSIPVNYRKVDEYKLFERLGSPELRVAEPIAHPNLAAHFDTFSQIGQIGARVLLTGFGGDAVLAGSTSYFLQLLRSREFEKLFVEVWRHVANSRSLAGMGLRSVLIPRKTTPPRQVLYPDWFDVAFAERVKLKERWISGWQGMNGPGDAFNQLNQPWLSRVFQSMEAIKLPLVARHPFFDVRLVAFLLGLPNFMVMGKKVMRESMYTKLPEPVRIRPKVGAAGDQIRAKFEHGRIEIPAESRMAFASKGYVDRGRYDIGFQKYLSGEGAESTWSSVSIITPYALDSWLEDHSH